MTALNESVNKIVSESEKSVQKTAKKIESSAKKKVSAKTDSAITKASSTVDKKAVEITTAVDKKTEDLAKLIRNTVNTDLETPVKEFISTSVENVVGSQLLSLNIKNLSDVEKMIEAESMFKTSYKVMDTEALTKEYCQTAEKSVNSIVNGGVDSLADKISSNKLIAAVGGSASVNKYIKDSKMVKLITQKVTTEFRNALNVIKDSKAFKMITDYTKRVVSSVTDMMKSLQTKIKDGIGKAKAEITRLKKAVKDKLAEFNKKKEEYIAKMNAEITKLKEKITAYMQKVTIMLVNEIKKVLNNIGAGIKKTISGVKL